MNEGLNVKMSYTETNYIKLLAIISKHLRMKDIVGIPEGHLGWVRREEGRRGPLLVFQGQEDLRGKGMFFLLILLKEPTF